MQCLNDANNFEGENHRWKLELWFEVEVKIIQMLRPSRGPVG